MIASNRKMGGFSGSWSNDWHNESAEVRKKRQLLQSEGVRFDKGVVCAECLHDFGPVSAGPNHKRKRSDAKN